MRLAEAETALRELRNEIRGLMGEYSERSAQLIDSADSELHVFRPARPPSASIKTLGTERRPSASGHLKENVAPDAVRPNRAQASLLGNRCATARVAQVWSEYSDAPASAEIPSRVMHDFESLRQTTEFTYSDDSDEEASVPMPRAVPGLYSGSVQLVPDAAGAAAPTRLEPPAMPMARPLETPRIDRMLARARAVAHGPNSTALHQERLASHEPARYTDQTAKGYEQARVCKASARVAFGTSATGDGMAQDSSVHGLRPAHSGGRPYRRLEHTFAPPPAAPDHDRAGSKSSRLLALVSQPPTPVTPLQPAVPALYLHHPIRACSTQRAAPRHAL